MEFLRFSIGPRGGRLACDCIKCSLRTAYPPTVCAACNQLRPNSEYDKTAHAGLICKVCLLSDPDRYLKQCSKCTAVKEISGFPMQGRTGYCLAICSSCDNRISLQKQNSLPKNETARRRRRHLEQMKEQAYAAYGGQKCACCGESELVFLTLDHVNNDGAQWRRKHFGANKGHGAGVRTYEWCKRNGYPPIFQVLCWNCQQGKRFSSDGICPHQRLETCRDHSVKEVGSSDPKRPASLRDGDMARSSEKSEAVPAADVERIQ